VYIDFTTFSLDCFNVLLNDPRLIFAFVSLNLAFSSYFRYFHGIFSAKTSISSVSSCIFDNWLFSARILTMGSDKAPFNQDCTLSFNFKQASPTVSQMDTLLYTGIAFKFIGCSFIFTFFVLKVNGNSK
jgi:hypothetical protein